MLAVLCVCGAWSTLVAVSACCTCHTCWLCMKWGASSSPSARGEWPLYNSKPFPSRMELRENLTKHFVTLKVTAEKFEYLEKKIETTQ